MQKYNPTPALVLLPDYNKPDHSNATTKHALKLRINYRRGRKYFGTGLKYTASEWEQINQIRPLKRYQEEKNRTDRVLGRAKEILAAMDAEGNEFKFARFETIWFQKKPKGTELYNLFRQNYEALKEERPKTADQYRLAYLSLWKFNGENNVRFADVTVDFLKSYEKWMLDGADDKDEDKKPRSKTTIGMYMRCTRHIFLFAIDKGFIKKESYPFGANRYAIPSGKNVKKALSPEEVNQLMNYKTESIQEGKARDMFLLSLFCNGANPKDLCKLKYSNMDGEKITFQRSKTLRTLKQPKIGTIILTPEIQAIINRWGNEDRSPYNYILPVLNRRFVRYDRKEKREVKVEKEEMAKRMDDLVGEFIKTTNKYLTHIFAALKINKHITMYAARHSYATILRNKGVSTEFIQEQLLHSSIMTTQNYLADFPDHVKREHAQTLLDAITLRN